MQALSQITENRKVETCKSLIFRPTTFTFALTNTTLRQSPIVCWPLRMPEVWDCWGRCAGSRPRCSK
jgi:hypothetical protein